MLMKINDKFRNFRYGILNIIRWTPIIWNDIDWDWTALASIMEYKLNRMADHEEKYEHHPTSLRDARQQRECARLLRCLIDDNYWEEEIKLQGKTKKAAESALRKADKDNEQLGRLLGKNLRNWWD